MKACGGSSPFARTTHLVSQVNHGIDNDCRVSSQTALVVNYGVPVGVGIRSLWDRSIESIVPIEEAHQ